MSAIDRDVVIKKYINPDIEKFHNSDVKIVLENLKQNILKMPAIDRLQGEWIGNNLDGTFKVWDCSECGIHIETRWNFCPNCGARMKGVEDE